MRELSITSKMNEEDEESNYVSSDEEMKNLN